MKIQLPLLTSTRMLRAWRQVTVQRKATFCVFTPKVSSSLRLNWVRVSLNGGKEKTGQ